MAVWRKPLLGMILAIAASSAHPQPTLQIASPEGALEATVGCDPVKLRTVVVVLAWKPAAREGTAERIDVTVFPNGFEKGLFASLESPERGGNFQFAAALARNAANAARAFDLVAEPAKPSERTGQRSVRIEHLEPGVRYSFRLAELSKDSQQYAGVVTFQAPICVADMKEG